MTIACSAAHKVSREALVALVSRLRAPSVLPCSGAECPQLLLLFLSPRADGRRIVATPSHVAEGPARDLMKARTAYASLLVVAAGLVIVACGGKPPPKEPPTRRPSRMPGADVAPEPPKPKSLYERLGKQDGITSSSTPSSRTSRRTASSTSASRRSKGRSSTSSRRTSSTRSASSPAVRSRARTASTRVAS